MAKVKLLHNAKAGDEEHSHHDLISLIESKGFNCEYASVKESGWNKISDDVDFLIVAGGDGTIRKVIEKLLQRKLIEKKFPIAILPLGTANNLAKTLEVDLPTEKAVESWLSFKRQSFDIGKIYGLGKRKFFIEGLGYGIFPYLIKRMQTSLRNTGDSPEHQLQIAREEFRNIIQTYEPCYCKIEVDGADHSGKYLMVEVMNTRSIGPNLDLGPDVEVDDGLFDIVLLTEDHRIEFSDYISAKLEGQKIEPAFKILKGRNIRLKWQGTDGHVDDERINIRKPEKIRIEVQSGLLEFLV